MKLKITFRQRYKKLPEAVSPPDVIIEIDNILERMNEIELERENLKSELLQKSIKMINYLKRYWSDEELKKAGFLVRK